MTIEKYLKSKLILDLTSMVIHIGLPSIYLNMHSMLVSVQAKRLKNGTENLQLKRVTLVIKIALPEGAYFFPLTLEAHV